MTPDARDQARHISEVTKAFAEGKEIQWSPKNSNGWRDFKNPPAWDWNACDYRVKPEERKHEKLAELLKRIGWKDTGDDQWENLEKAMPGIRWLLSPDDEERKPSIAYLWLHPNKPGVYRTESYFSDHSDAEKAGWVLTTFAEVLTSENTGGQS